MKVYFSLHIWKEHVEIDQITNFHVKKKKTSLFVHLYIGQGRQRLVLNSYASGYICINMYTCTLYIYIFLLHRMDCTW